MRNRLLHVRQHFIWHRTFGKETLCGIKQTDVEGEPMKYSEFLANIRGGDMTCETCQRRAMQLAKEKRS